MDLGSHLVPEDFPVQRIPGQGIEGTVKDVATFLDRRQKQNYKRNRTGMLVFREIHDKNLAASQSDPWAE